MLSALDCKRFALWSGEFRQRRKVSAQVLVPAAIFSDAMPRCASEIRQAKRTGHAVVHDAGGGHRLCLPFSDRGELWVGLDGR